MKYSMSKRNVSLDIIRCFALLCVVSIHFFLNTSYYSIPIQGSRRMYLMTLVRTGATICVPLFLMLSGYLTCNKKLSPGYFLKLGKTLSLYVLAGITCVLYLILRWSYSYTFEDIVTQTLNFTLSPYGWYIEMYIGLFLLTPFLNICYNNIDSQKNKRNLILVMIFLTSLPSVLNIYDVTNLQWWSSPISSNNYMKITPSWWLGSYPLTYYFIGCYLREYPLKIKKQVNLLLIVLVWIASGSFAYYRSYGSTYVNGIWQEYYSLFTLTQAVLVFNFLVQCNFEQIGNMHRRILAYMSDWALGAYLLSFVFDVQYYTILRTKVPEGIDQLSYFFAVVPMVYISSLLASGMLNLVHSVLHRSFDWMWKKIRLLRKMTEE